MRRLAGIGLALAGLLALSNCGTGFKLPAEVRRVAEPGNGTYERIATWTGFTGVTDILLTKTSVASNEQLYVLFNSGPPLNQKRLAAYPLLTPSPLSFQYLGLKNPVAVCGSATRLFVLDQGDTCAARTNPVTLKCDTTGNYLLPPPNHWTNKVSYPDRYWRIHEYFPDGGDTVSTFTDTTMAWVQGIAVDDQERVYVSGVFILVTVNPDNPFYFYRRFVWRIFRYVRGGGDPNLPGSNWHRDPAYVVEEGSGLGTASDPRGLDWSPVDGGALFIADTGNNRAQRRSDPPSTNDYLLLDSDKGALRAPNDVTTDLAGYSYVTDAADTAVFRFRAAGQGLGEFVQRVDLEPSASGQKLQRPVAVAADNDLVYVADAGRGEIAVFRRRR